VGTPGHMAHPFDVDKVKTGQDLIDYINDAVLRLQNKEIAGSVKWDGINTSFKLITTDDGKKEFRMDRGTSEIGSVIGFNAQSALEKWGTKHGMTQAIVKLLKIFDKALPLIEPELKELGMWDDPTKYFNTEYVTSAEEGKSNVQEYEQNILAIHSINQFYEKRAQEWRKHKGTSMDRPGLERPIDPKTGKLVTGTGIEISYNKEALASLIEKVQPIAAAAGFEIYGDVPVGFDPDVELNLDAVLDTPISVQITPGGVATNTLREWLGMVEHPQARKVTKADGRSVGALSKDIYMAVLRSAEEGGVPLSDYLSSQDDVKDAINGGIFYHGTRLLGQAVKNALTSAAGSVGKHEGVVLRGMEDFLVKLTGDFIVQGLASTHGTSIVEEEWAPLDKDWRRNYGREDMSGYVPHRRLKKRNIALYPGKFKPPHGGHFNVVKQVVENPNVDKLVVFISPKEHEGITAEQSAAIWDFYKTHLPGNIEIRISDITPVRAVYEYLDQEAQVGDDLHLVLGEKDIQGGRFDNTEGRREGIGVGIVPVPPQMGGISATKMRSALRAGKNKVFKKGLPKELNDSEINDIIAILGGTLDEISTMAGGNIAGGMIGTGSKKGPWHNLDVDKENRIQKRNARLRGADEFLKEEIVSEVADYLIGITVG